MPSKRTDRTSRRRSGRKRSTIAGSSTGSRSRPSRMARPAMPSTVTTPQPRRTIGQTARSSARPTCAVYRDASSRRSRSAEQVPQQLAREISHLALLRDLAARRQLVDQLGQDLRQDRAALLRRQPGLLRHLRHLGRERPLERPRIDRTVLSRADPRVDHVAEPGFLEAPDKALEPTGPRVVQHGDDGLQEAAELVLVDLGSGDRLLAGGLCLALALQHPGKKVFEQSHGVRLRWWMTRAGSLAGPIFQAGG